MASAGNVVLPVHYEEIGGLRVERGPMPVLAAAVAGLGHVRLIPDADGRLRHFRLAEAERPSLPMAMLALAGHEAPNWTLPLGRVARISADDPHLLVG